MEFRDAPRQKGPVCGIENCRSKLYDEGEDGYLYCQNGHRKGDLVVGQDENNFTTARRVTTRKRGDQEGEEKQYKYFKGQQALDLYLKCLQLILRHQVWFLVREKGLPEELETVVLDLWALRILQLESQVGEGRGYDSQSQGFSASDSESGFEKEESGSRSQEKKLKSTPTLIDSLALCYLGIITLRLPITPGDIHAWVMDGKIAYRRAIKHVPPTMRDRLPAHYHAILDPNAILTYERFYKTVTHLNISFQKEYGIVWPSLNHPLLLFRLLRDLALPLELYDATIQLSRYLDYNFTYTSHNPGKRGARHPPEIKLIACLVVCVKLIYPFDGPPRYPKASSEPSATTIDWDEWHTHLSSSKTSTQDSVKRYTPEELTNLQEKDVFPMSSHQLDQYLDWYQDSFIDEARTDKTANSDYRNALYTLFPVDRERDDQPSNQQPGHRDKLDVVKAVHGMHKPRMVVEERDDGEDTVRPGMKYRVYRRVEDLPVKARRFFEEAARVGGMSVDMLVLAVFFAEMRIGYLRGKGGR